MASSIDQALVRADELMKAAPSRRDPSTALRQAEEVLADAHDRLDQVTFAAIQPTYSANLPLRVLEADDVLFAWAHEGARAEHRPRRPAPAGGPLRYGWKSVKWVSDVRLTERDVPGYWEERGYHAEGDPWRQQRFQGD